MKVIIVEDEFLAQQELSWLINTHSQMEIVGSFDDGLDVLKFLQHNKVDAIFLDINIPSLDGVLLAQNISQFAHKPFIVFITAWKEHAVEAFELEAFDYILGNDRLSLLQIIGIFHNPEFIINNKHSSIVNIG